MHATYIYELTSEVPAPEHILPTLTSEGNQTTVATNSKFTHPNPRSDCLFNETSESGNPNLDDSIVAEEISYPAPKDYTTGEWRIY